MRDCIPINKKLVPYQFNLLLAGEWFKLYVNYNKTADMFTVSLYKNDEYITTEPMVLGVPMFQDVYQPGIFPAVTMEPFGPIEKSITFDNFGKTVFLTIDNEGDSDE